MCSMPSLAFTGDAKFAFAVSVGLALVVLARWASRTRGTKRDTWVALRIGDVLFTEIIGAFLLGYGLGGLIAPPEVAGPGGPPVRIGQPDVSAADSVRGCRTPSRSSARHSPS